MNRKRSQPLEEETIAIERSWSENRQSHQRVQHIITEETKPVAEDESVRDKSLDITLSGFKYGSKLFCLSFVLVFAWLFYAVILDLLEAWQSNAWFVMPLGIMALILMLLLMLVIKREYRAFRQVDDIAKQKNKINEYRAQDSVAGIHAVLKQRLMHIKKYYPDEYQQFEQARDDRQTVEEYVSLLNNIVLARLDKEADNSIKKASLSIAALVAISPHPALDAFIVLYRANHLIRKISLIYGLKPTGLSSLYLFKHSVVSAITAAGVEEISTLLAEEISMGLGEKAAQLIAEGAVSATRLYRLGHITKKIVRPVETS